MPNVRNLKAPRNLIDTEAAYVAGFWDGEGTIGIYREKRRGNKSGVRFKAGFSVCQTKVEVLLEIQTMLGCGNLCSETNERLRKKDINAADIFKLTFSSNEIRHLLPQLRPWLKLKQKQADILLDFLGKQKHRARQTPGFIEEVEELKDKITILNKRGKQAV